MNTNQPSALSAEMQQGLVVLFDGACQTCIEDRDRYQTWLSQQTFDGRIRVYWLDLNQAPEVLAQFNIDYQSAIVELHIIADGHRIVKELDAYILLFKQLSWGKPIAWLIGLPLIKPLLAKYYRYRVNKRLKTSCRI